MNQVLALLDANNFYCSCERVFRPDLEHRPVIVLSNNDGCAVARSNEAKAMGIQMGAPWFQIREAFESAGGVAFSSNYTLYADMSARIGEVLAQFSDTTEVYSIDESFVAFAPGDERDLVGIARAMRSTVRLWTGIPCCVGLGATKTLAKAANFAAKKQLLDDTGVVSLLDPVERDRVLSIIPVDEVWGVGRASAAKLDAIGITTAAQLARLDRRRARQLLTVTGERLVAELAGIPCIPLEQEPMPPQSCAVTRSFGRPIETWSEMEAAIATYATRAGEKLRRSDRVAGLLQVFMQSSRFARERPYANAATMRLAEATADSMVLITAATQLGRRLWRSGVRFTKAGIILTDLVAAGDGQKSMLYVPNRARSAQLMEAMDRINSKMGAGTILPATAGVRRPWAVRADRRTPRYTTCWDELPRVQ